ncbi:60S ribosomal export protein NMD3 [uncultured Methanobrevibacter sp.]|uniref:60S ribosomal export protein NMD3 n=1 Tax=uncultured Methanobrevibacter sp. TaxID=253161 RepID=UPI00262BC207
MFCPECGATDVEMIDNICKNCFLKKFQLMTIPENITVTVCSHCNAKLEEGKWKDEYLPDEEIIYRALERNISLSDLAENEEIELEIDQMRGTIAECYVEAVATVLGEEIVETHTPDVKINHSVCPDCSKKAAGYYEAVIQLRADKRDLDEKEIETSEEIIYRTLKKQMKKDKLAYIPQVAKLKEGNDYYIGSYKTAKKLVEHLKDELGAIVKESPRLISEDKNTGKGLYRIWISVRLPNFQKGEFIKYNDGIYKIISIDGKRIQILNLDTMEKTALKWREYDSIEKMADTKDIQKVIITAKSPKSIQVLDPEDYSPVDLEMNENLQDCNIGEEIDCIKINGKIYLINQD